MTPGSGPFTNKIGVALAPVFIDLDELVCWLGMAITNWT